MLSKLIEFSLQNRFVVLVGVLLCAILGVVSALRLPIDAVPDMTNVQVQITTNAGSLSPIEVERLVTIPIESTMSGLPRIEELRSISRYGISLVTIVFEEDVDIYWARNLVTERLPEASSRLPDDIERPQLGPLTTALGEILQFELRSDKRSDMDLRTMLEWDVAPRLREVPGVVDVNSHGGAFKTFEVRPDPKQLIRYKVSLEELYDRLQANNATIGGGYLIHQGEQRFVRGVCLFHSIPDIQQTIVARTESGIPILVQDLAEVTEAPMTRQGAVTRDGRGEAVTGLTMMLIGENSRTVVARVKERLAEIQETLPEDVTIEVIYDRSELIGRTLETVIRNLVEGGVLVIVILLIMLGSVRAGLIVALAIPLSMLFASNLMYGVGITASLMSLGAIDFGLVVDSSVIMIENCIRRLGHAKPYESRIEIIKDAAIEVRKPTMFGELIIAVVYLPILTLEGTEGKLFRPMALTVLFALAGSLVLSLTFMPAIASLILPKNIKETEVWPVRMLKKLYEPIVAFAIRSPLVVVAISVSIFILSIPVARNLGGEFMPRLVEGDLLVEAVRLPSATIEDATRVSTEIEKVLKEFPEVKTVFSKTGRPEIANDVMGVHQTDVWVMLKPQAEWPSHRTRDELITAMGEKLNASVQGVVFGFTQPIEMRVDELVAGVKADVAVLIYGDDLAVLNEKGKQIEAALRKLPGAVDVKADYQADLQSIRIEPDRQALARLGIDASQVLNVVAAMGGRNVGQLQEGKVRFPVLVRFPPADRTSIELIKSLPIINAQGEAIPLSAVASVIQEQTPPSIEHESNRRRTFVSANVRGRDVASFVEEAQRVIEAEVSMPAGYEIKWGGDFENLQSASSRLMIITPIVLLIIFILLHSTFRSASLAILIFLAVPLAASGGIFALALREMPFSISAGIGFIALSGVAVLNGLVWVSAAENLRATGASMAEVCSQTASMRLRPILMTALVASFGFIPMALSHGDGAELQRPLATVVIGGLITSTLLTSIVVPAIYPWFAPKRIRPMEQ